MLTQSIGTIAADKAAFEGVNGRQGVSNVDTYESWCPVDTYKQCYPLLSFCRLVQALAAAAGPWGPWGLLCRPRMVHRIRSLWGLTCS